MRHNFFVILIISFSFLLLSPTFAATSTIPQWAKSVTAGSNSSLFNSITVDSKGNTYAAGYISGTSSYDFGNGVIVSGGFSGQNAILVKYDGNGIAQWAKSILTGSGNSSFGYVTGNVNSDRSLVVDSNGNIYVVGYINGTGTCNFGNSVTVSGASNSNNILLVKYDSNGNAQWAKSSIAGSSESIFTSIAVDLNGNIYAAGYINGNGSYYFGNDVTVSGGTSGQNNVVLVKYSNNGKAQWARSVTGGSSYSQFNSITVDSSGNIYAAGTIYTPGNYNFGNGVIVTGGTQYNNTILVKYDGNGNALWAKTTTSGFSALFYSVSLDIQGNIYAAGYIAYTATYGFGNNVTVTGSTSSTYKPVLIKYDDQGNAQWVRSLTSGSGDSYFNSIITDTNENIYAAGYINSGTYNFGNDITATGISNPNLVMVKYDNKGNAQEARGITSGSGGSQFYSLAFDKSNNCNIYAAGYITGNANYYFENDVATTGAYSGGNNAMVIKYLDQTPTLTSIIKSACENSAISFATSDFTNSYHDNCLSSKLTKIKILSLPLGGTLKFSGINVLVNEEIAAKDLDDLVFVPDSDWKGITSFNWNGCGNNSVSYPGNQASVNINIHDINSIECSKNWVVPTIAGGAVGGILIGTALNYFLYKHNSLCYKNRAKIQYTAISTTDRDVIEMVDMRGKGPYTAAPSESPSNT